MPLHVSSTMCSSSGGQNFTIQPLVSSHWNSRSWDKGVLTDLCLTLYIEMHGQQNIKKKILSSSLTVWTLVVTIFITKFDLQKFWHLPAKYMCLFRTNIVCRFYTHTPRVSNPGPPCCVMRPAETFTNHKYMLKIAQHLRWLNIPPVVIFKVTGRNPPYINILKILDNPAIKH